MTDFVAYRGEFKSRTEWPQERRTKYLQSLLAVIEHAELSGASSAVHVEAVTIANACWKQTFTPFTIAAAMALCSFRDFHKDDEAEILLDRTPEHGRCEQLKAAESIILRLPRYRDWWLEERVSWRFLTKQQVQQHIPAKDAADLQAWESRAFSETRLRLSAKGFGSHWSGFRKSIIALGRTAPTNGLIHSHTELRNLYQAIGSPVADPPAEDKK